MLLSWAAEHWTEVESRIALATLSRAGGPARPLDLDAKMLLVLIEGVLREVPERSAELDKIYVEAKAAAAERARLARMTADEILAEKRAKRRAEIEALQRTAL